MSASQPATNSPAHRRPSIVLLAVVASLSPFAMAVLLPALPTLVERYQSSYAEVQFVVSAYLAGLGISQLLAGFLCDRYGRRPVALAGYSLFVLASVACAYAESISALTGLRFLQAAGVSAGTVVARAVVRDLYAAEVGARAMSYITIGLGTAPVIAPMLGGWLIEFGEVAPIFFATALIGGIVLALIVVQLAETRDPSTSSPDWGRWLDGYVKLLGSRAFLGYTAVYGFVQGSFFSFLAVGASVFANDFGLGPRSFGIVWGLMAVAYVIGATVGGRLSTGALAPRLLPAAALGTPLAGMLLFALVAGVGSTPATVLPPMAVLMVLSGVATPLVLAGAVYERPEAAGTAAGLSSALGLVVGSSFTVLSGLVYDGHFLPVAGLILISTMLTTAGWLLVRQR